MRFVSTFLMIYVLVLTLIPCSDHYFDTQANNHNHIHSYDEHKESSDGNDRHDCGEDTCTPFCTCSCCGIALNAANFHVFSLEKPIEIYNYRELAQQSYPLISLFSGNIWQPPKV